MMKLIVWSVLGCCLLSYTLTEEIGLCDETFCKTYLARHKCMPLPEACLAQNFTHNGVFLPYPGACDCCERYCLENIAQREACSKGDPTSQRPTEICGPLLACQLGKETYTTCERMSSICVEAQNQYDEARKRGTLGHLQLRPVCDRNGLYAPFACIPGEICYCVSKDGKRLFGEIPYTVQAQYILRCKCSRSYEEALQNGYGNLHSPDFLRCQSQGDFDPIQCADQDQCICTDTEDGHTTYPNREPISMSDISELNLPCFDPKIHTDGAYYQKCELEYIKQLNVLRQFKQEEYDVFGTVLPNCQLDGFYGPVQYKDNMKYCSDPLGNKLENFEVSEFHPSALTMNCKCARARSLITGPEKPDCCDNGNYKRIQCRRGLCRCVDENGVQIQKEVEFTEKESLPCFERPCD